MATSSWCSERIYVCVVRDVEPTDDEWSHFIDLCRMRSGRELRALVQSDKTGPNAIQRKALAEATAEIDYRAAILTNSFLTRGIVTAFSWLGVPQKAFLPDSFAAAGDYLELTHDELDMAMRELARLRDPSMRSATPDEASAPRQ